MLLIIISQKSIIKLLLHKYQYEDVLKMNSPIILTQFLII